MCLIILLVPLLGPVALAALLVIASAPAAFLYLLPTHPDQFGEFWVGWLLALPASPFVAYWLAGLRPAPTKRLRARRAEYRAQIALRNTPAHARARKRRRLQQTALVLPITSAAGLLSIQTMISAENTISLVGFIVLLGAVPVAMIPLSIAFLRWEA